MQNIKTVYEHIRGNNIKTFLLVALFPVIFIVLIFLFVWAVAPLSQAVETTLAVAIPTVLVCFVWMLISWAFGDSMILSANNAIQITAENAEYRDVLRSVENVARAAGLPMPRVYVINDNGLNAFATGRTPNDASVALTRGIIKKLNRLELEGVIAHEMAHIGNRDIRLDMMIITGVGVTVFVADILWRSAMYGNFSDENNDNKTNMGAVLMMVALALSAFNLIITPLLRMAISRNREYAADATGAFITRNPHALASALGKISENSCVNRCRNNKSMDAIYIAEPVKERALFADAFATHPPVEKRIARLESMSL